MHHVLLGQTCYPNQLCIICLVKPAILIKIFTNKYFGKKVLSIINWQRTKASTTGDSHKHQPLARNKPSLKIPFIKMVTHWEYSSLKIVLNDLSQTTVKTLVLQFNVNNQQNQTCHKQPTSFRTSKIQVTLTNTSHSPEIYPALRFHL